MGNICTSPKNNFSADERPVRNTERSNLITSSKPIDKWDVEDVFNWLSQIDDGALHELAVKFRKNKIRGCILDNVKEVQLVEMDVALGDRMLFNQKKIELFHKYNYMPNNILMDQNSNQSNPIGMGGSQPPPPAPHSIAHSIHSNYSHQSNSPNACINKGEGVIAYDNQIIDDNISGHHSIKSMPKPTSIMQYAPQPQPQQPMHNFHHMRHTSAQMGYPIQPQPQQYPPINRSIPPPYVNSNTQLQSSSSGGNIVVPGGGAGNIDTIEEDHYAAVNFKDLDEGIDINNTVNNSAPPQVKPPLNRSASADDFKQNPRKINNKNFKKSASNPIHKSNANAQSKLDEVLKIASILKDSMGGEIKTGAQIISILSTKDTTPKSDDINDGKYEQICQVLLAQNLLSTKDKSLAFSLLRSYQFNNTKYESLENKNKSNSINLQSRSLSNISRGHNLNSISISSEYKYCGGTQVKVFSPKSNKIRPGLILSYDEHTKKAQICCYDSMGKQSMKTLPLPHPCVKPHYPAQPPLSLSPHYPSQPPPQPQPQPPQPQQHVPMTVDSWNYYVRDNNRNVM